MRGTSIRQRFVAAATVSCLVAGAAVVSTTISTGTVLALPGASESTTVNVSPTRGLDTRVNVGLTGKFLSKVSRKFQVTGTIPTYDETTKVTTNKEVVPSGATGVIMNITAIAPTGPGFLAIRPGDATGDPSTAGLNFNTGDVIPNHITVNLPTTGPNAGQIDMTYGQEALGHTMDVVIDIVGYATSEGLQDLVTKFKELRESYNLLGTSPVKVSATPGATVDIARTAAPETPLFKQGTIDVYAKCMFDTTSGEIRGEIFVRTTVNGAMMEGTDDLPGTSSGTTFLDTTTAEASRQLDIQSHSTPDAAGYNQLEGAITSAEGRSYLTSSSIGVKQGSPAGGNGPFGTGNVCLFGGNVMG